ncbi:MAG: YihY/virulence factor BrkB family protein [Actinomycetota bacterium]|nr:YihY/virulence factor BrkB family protein [Actinomycetota bacterium]MDP2288303.1 YihY/virulence factor BrkB family protein [Actinomycetota bacterium]
MHSQCNPKTVATRLHAQALLVAVVLFSMGDSSETEMQAIDELPGPLRKLDSYQQKHPSLSVPIAVFKKFGDDEAGKLAALISYFAFLSVFPLLIVFATILSHALAGQTELAGSILSTAAGSFLSIGSTDVIEPLDVSGPALVIGVLVGLWAGLAVANAMQDAMNTIYEVPKNRRAGFFPFLLRSLTLLLLVGIGLPTVTLLQAIAIEGVNASIATVAILIVAALLNTAIIAASFRRATVAKTTWLGVLPGAAIAAIAWAVMQALATSLLTRQITHAEANYGSFAAVIGLLFWFFLLAQVTIYCAELNVVVSYRLWPRGLKSIFKGVADTEADIRAYSHYPKRELQVLNMQVNVEVVEGKADPVE